jgi:hypothetical protein
MATVEVAPFTATTLAALRLSEAELSAPVPAVLQVSVVIVTDPIAPLPEMQAQFDASAVLIDLSSSLSQASNRAALDWAQPSATEVRAV